MDVSNKALVFLLLAAIVISVGGTAMSLHLLSQFRQAAFPIGYATATSTATTNLTITNAVAIDFVNANVNFGTGYVWPGVGVVDNCTMDTNSTNPANASPQQACIGFNTSCAGQPFNLRNDGNVNLNVSLQMDANASALIGGTYPLLQWYVSNNSATVNGCQGTDFVPQWANVNVTASQKVCDSLKWQSGFNVINVSMKVQIPDDALPGVRIVNITATGNNP